MGNFNFVKTGIDGLIVVEPTIYGDDRGYFMETYHYEEFRQAGISSEFVQDNQSLSKKGVLRGLHFQTLKPQGKLVRVLEGEVFDVAVDIRKGSATFRQWYGIKLSGQNRKQMYIPEGFAHGFLVLSEFAIFSYKCTDFYDPENESGLLWNDPELGITWPLNEVDNIIVSPKDKNWMGINELEGI